MTQGITSRPTSRPLLLLLVTTAVAAAVASRWWSFVDLRVYRYGGQSVLEGLPVYAAGEPGSGLLFTYPPFAALVMTALGVVPLWLAVAALTAGGMASLALTLHCFGVRPQWIAPLTLAALALDPVRETLEFGQVNLVLMALVTYDLLVLRGRWAGVLVGIAAGVKLTPLVFVVLLLVVGRRAAATRAASAFVATVLAGVLLLPGDAAAYWGRAVWDSDRIGGLEYVRNQSLNGTLTRLLHHDASTATWLLTAAPVGLVLLGAAALWWRRGDQQLSVLLAAGAMLLCSPISWDHHFVWAAPLLVVLWRRAPRLAVPVAALLVVGVRRTVEHGSGSELTWHTWQQLPGNGFTWLVLLLGAWAVVRSPRPAGSQSPTASMPRWTIFGSGVPTTASSRPS